MKIKPFLKTVYNKTSKDLRLSPEALSIPIVGAYQVINNHKKALPNEKKNTFKRDSVVLLATCFGALLGHGASSAVLKNKKSLATIKKDLIKMVFIPVGGIITGLMAGEFAEKYFPAKYHDAQKLLEKKVSEKIVKTLKTTKSKSDRIELDNKLFKSVFVMTLSAVGILLGNESSKKLLKSQYIKNLNLSQAPKGIISLAGSLLGGAVIGKAASLSLSDNKKSQFNIANDQLAGILNKSVSTMTGFNVGTQFGLQNKVQRGFYEMISSVLFPAAVVIPASHFVRTKIGKNKVNPKIYEALSPLSKNLKTQKKIFEKSIVLSVLASSIYIGGIIGNMINKKLASKLADKEAWAQLDLMHQKFMFRYINGDDNQKENAIKAIKAVKEIKENLN